MKHTKRQGQKTDGKKIFVRDIYTNGTNV